MDQTELQGAWDFTFKFTPKDTRRAYHGRREYSAVRRPGETARIEAGGGHGTYARDCGGQRESETHGQCARCGEEFSATPTEFDAAEIKPAVAQTGGGRGGTLARPEIKNGRIYVPNITLKNLITLAWDVNGDDMLVGRTEMARFGPL